MPKLNWKVILCNLAEAHEQIEQIEEQAKSDKKLSEPEFQIMLEHVYHHLNFAWHTRHVSTEKYKNLTDDDFNEWSRFPQEMAKIKQANN